MTPEQQARDMMERAGWDGAQGCSAGDVVEIANLISDNERLTAELDRQTAVASALFDSLSEAERDSEWLYNELGIAINELNAIAHDHDADARSLRLSAADAVIRYNADLKARTTDSAEPRDSATPP